MTRWWEFIPTFLIVSYYIYLHKVVFHSPANSSQATGVSFRSGKTNCLFRISISDSTLPDTWINWPTSFLGTLCKSFYKSQWNISIIKFEQKKHQITTLHHVTIQSYSLQQKEKLKIESKPFFFLIYCPYELLNFQPANFIWGY